MKNKKKIYLSIIISLFSFVMVNGQDIHNEVKTVDNVDLKKYIGSWYEISIIPNSFQDQCIKNTTATYSLNEDGTITVLNKCTEEDGEIDSAEGIAKIVDTTTNSKLEVSFVSILGIHLFWGDYWILGLEENYQYVVVGTPNRKYGWILARKPTLEEADYRKCEEILTNNGYDPSEFIMSPQEY